MTKITIDTGGKKGTKNPPRGELITCPACRGTGIDALGNPHKPCGGTGKLRM